jgi:hypothetical protein
MAIAMLVARTAILAARTHRASTGTGAAAANAGLPHAVPAPLTSRTSR